MVAVIVPKAPHMLPPFTYGIFLTNHLLGVSGAPTPYIPLWHHPASPNARRSVPAIMP